MKADGAPVAARNEQAVIKDDANLHVVVTGATKKFHLWQQGPAWLLGFAAVGLGFLMVLRNYDSAAGWFGFGTAVDHYTSALESRRAIGMAIGIVMERYQIDDDRAFAFLVRVSQHSNVKLRDVAADIISETAARSERA